MGLFLLGKSAVSRPRGDGIKFTPAPRAVGEIRGTDTLRVGEWVELRGAEKKNPVAIATPSERPRTVPILRPSRHAQSAHRRGIPRFHALSVEWRRFATAPPRPIGAE